MEKGQKIKQRDIKTDNDRQISVNKTLKKDAQGTDKGKKTYEQKIPYVKIQIDDEK